MNMRGLARLGAISGVGAAVALACVGAAAQQQDASRGKAQAAAASQKQMHTEEREARAPFMAGAPLRVTARNGGIAVRAGEGNEAVIRAQLKSESAERIAAAEITTERLDDGTLVIGVRWPEGESGMQEGCSFDVTLPPARDVELRSANGNIAVGGMSGETELWTGNGSITVDGHAGSVVADTRNGAVTVRGAEGAVHVLTNNGNATVLEAGAAVDVESGNGRAEAVLSSTCEGPIRVLARNGSAEVRLGRAFRGQLGMRASNGRVGFEGLPDVRVQRGGGSSVTLGIGDGGGPSEVEARNGNVRVLGWEAAADE